VKEYFPDGPGFDDTHAIPVDYLATLLGAARMEPVPIPHDCTDGFAADIQACHPACLAGAVLARLVRASLSVRLVVP